MNHTVALVPVKPLAASKSRLAPVLSDAERRALSVQLLEKVLTAVQAAHTVDACWVIGGDAVIKTLAARYDARWLPELGVGLNDTLTQALEQLPADVSRALILPMDLPFLNSQAVDALIAQLAEDQADVVIAPDRWKQGTNALLLTRPFLLHPAFGLNSLTRHRQAAEAQNLRVVLHETRELAFDIDTPADLSDATTNSTNATNATHKTN